jgi:N-formylglutamate amidohydrolase
LRRRFVTSVQEIAAAIARVKQRMGDCDAGSVSGGGSDEGIPYQVIARFHRGYIDANRHAHQVCKLQPSL